MNINKVVKALGTGVQEEIDAMKEEDLRSVIIESSHHIETANSEMAANDGVKEAKENLKAICGPWRDAVKAQKAKIQYALHRLEQLGKL